jgi:hypothetical protein
LTALLGSISSFMVNETINNTAENCMSSTNITLLFYITIDAAKIAKIW